MNTEQAYINGFVKRAADYGYTKEQATEMFKEAESSFLGRYLASKQELPSMMSQDSAIMDELDPEGTYRKENLFFTPDMVKQRRDLAYKRMRKHLQGQDVGSTLQHALLGGAIGGLGGAAGGHLTGAGLRNSAIAAGLGATVGGGAAALARMLQKKLLSQITDEDIERMQAQRKDKGLFRGAVPFSDIYDAAKS
jgi:hypothetical protein